MRRMSAVTTPTPVVPRSGDSISREELKECLAATVQKVLETTASQFRSEVEGIHSATRSNERCIQHLAELVRGEREAREVLTAEVRAHGATRPSGTSGSGGEATGTAAHLSGTSGSGGDVASPAAAPV